MTRTRAAIVLTFAVLVLLAACDEENPNVPPTITYGVSACADCDMIISDERFAAATVVADERGRPSPLLFDDIGDQIRYEADHPSLTVLARWVHDHDSRQWLRAETAIYVRSTEIRSPMASGIAAFAARAGADELRSDLAHSDVLTFSDLWPGANAVCPTRNHTSHERTTP